MALALSIVFFGTLGVVVLVGLGNFLGKLTFWGLQKLCYIAAFLYGFYMTGLALIAMPL